MNRIIGKKRVVILGFLFVCVAGGCSRSVPDVSYQIETDKPCQTMAYFSASDAWSMQFIGLWPEEKQNQVADWLFSTENDANGQPKGIGLSSGVSMSVQAVRNKGRLVRSPLPGCEPSVF